MVVQVLRRRGMGWSLRANGWYKGRRVAGYGVPSIAHAHVEMLLGMRVLISIQTRRKTRPATFGMHDGAEEG